MTLIKRAALMVVGMLSLRIGMMLLEVPTGLAWWETLFGGAAIATSVLSTFRAVE